jgi:NADH dehydrogenase FAD-containing subunit
LEKTEDITLKVSEILKPRDRFIHDAAKQIDTDSSKVITAKGKSFL